MDSLDFNQTRYRHSHDQEGEFWITFQKDRVFSAGSLTYLVELGKRTTAAHERGATWAQAYDEAFPVMDASGLAAFNTGDEHSLVQQSFQLRCSAEGVTPVSESPKAARSA